MVMFHGGIPSITLTGTVADWQQIRERVDVIAELDLAAWCRSLAPIADRFVRAAAGDVDVAFWRRIYNPADAYGGEVISRKAGASATGPTRTPARLDGTCATFASRPSTRAGVGSRSHRRSRRRR
jgi:fructose-1,6-bisphosphatase/inositol monophosphatase family enzyme